MLVQQMAIGSSLDILLNERESVKEKYHSVITTPRNSPNTERIIFSLQHRIISLDDSIINVHLKNLIKEKAQVVQMSELQQLRNSKTIARMEDRMEGLINNTWMLTIALFSTLFVSVVLLMLLIINYRKYKGLAKRHQASEYIIHTLKKKVQYLQTELDTLNKIYPVKPGKLFEKPISNQRSNRCENNSEYKQKFEEAQRNLSELTETNNNLYSELQRLIRRESSTVAENNRLQNEVSNLARELQETKQELQNLTVHYQPTEVGNQSAENTTLKSIIETYKDRLEKEEKARKNFEREVNEILSGFQNYVEKL
jgi:DNA repair exonuclease SbcCD ATPase subunit